MNLQNLSGLLAITAAALLYFLAVPQARADIIEIEGATSCPGSLGGGLCDNGSPFTLSGLLQTLAAPNSVGNGTQKYVVTDNLSSNGFSFVLTSTGQNSTGIANNGQCQVNGGAMSIFTGCSIVDSAGNSTSLGGAQINNLTFPITVTFSGSSLFGKTFDLGFVSMQGSSSISPAGSTGDLPVPEPTSLVLLGMGMSGLLIRRLIGRAVR